MKSDPADESSQRIRWPGASDATASDLPLQVTLGSQEGIDVRKLLVLVADGLGVTVELDKQSGVYIISKVASVKESLRPEATESLKGNRGNLL